MGPPADGVPLVEVGNGLAVPAAARSRQEEVLLVGVATEVDLPFLAGQIKGSLAARPDGLEIGSREMKARSQISHLWIPIEPQKSSQYRVSQKGTARPISFDLAAS